MGFVVSFLRILLGTLVVVCVLSFAIRWFTDMESIDPHDSRIGIAVWIAAGMISLVSEWAVYRRKSNRL